LAILALWMMAPVTMPVPVLRELVRDRFDVSELLTSLFMSINMLGALLTAPVAGALADRLGRRGTLLAIGLAADGICLLLLTASIPFGVFLCIRFLEGCAHILALSVLLSLASQARPAEQRGRAMGLVGGGMMLGVALGAPLGGWLGRSDALLPLQAGGGMLLVGAIVAALVARDSGGHEQRPTLRDIVAALRAHPSILAPLAFAFADRFTVGFFTTTFPLYLRRIHDLAPSQIGLLIAVFMLPFALGSYPFGRLAERRSIVGLLCGGSLLYGIGTASVGFTPPEALFLLMLGIGLTAAVMFVPSMLMTVQLAPDAIRSTALGAFNAAGSLGFVLGPIVGGAVSQLVAAQAGWIAGYRAAFVTAGVSEALCVAVTLPILLRLRRERRIH
jgi:MFS family permease